MDGWAHRLFGTFVGIILAPWGGWVLEVQGSVSAIQESTILGLVAQFWTVQQDHEEYPLG